MAIGIVRDVMDRREPQERLGLLSVALDHLRDAAYIADEEGRVRYVNDETCRLLGRGRDELLAARVPDIDDALPGDHWASHWEELKTHGGLKLEARYRKGDGSIVPVEVSVSYLEDDGRGYQLALVRDVSDPHAMLNGIRQGAKSQAVETRVAEHAAAVELEAFAYSVSHDLRAPLRHIDGFVQLLEHRIAPSLDERSRHYMRAISGAARRMGTLLDALLSFSRVARAELREERVDLAALAHEVIADSKADLRDRTVEWRVGALPVVRGDRALLRVVLANLVSNAVKFTVRCPVTVVEVGSTNTHRGEVVVFVRDNGVGFDPMYAGKLFGVFQRLHLVDEYEGAGIGLATVRRIVSRHRGRTWAEGQVDRGATFYFSLPAPPEEV